MRLNALLSLSLCSALARAADLSNFKAGPGVEPELKGFLETYFPFSEHKQYTTEWTDWWHPDDGSITKGGQVHTTPEARLAAKQALFPSPDFTLEHILYDVVVAADTVRSKTYNETVFVEVVDGASGWCGAFGGFVIAEVKKTDGKVDLTPHGGNYLTYILDIPTTPNAECRSRNGVAADEGAASGGAGGDDGRDEL
ncbi:unnamed protein product [Discula destructiva]